MYADMVFLFFAKMPQIKNIVNKLKKLIIFIFKYILKKTKNLNFSRLGENTKNTVF